MVVAVVVIFGANSHFWERKHKCRPVRAHEKGSWAGRSCHLHSEFLPLLIASKKHTSSYIGRFSGVVVGWRNGFVELLGERRRKKWKFFPDGATDGCRVRWG